MHDVHTERESMLHVETMLVKRGSPFVEERCRDCGCAMLTLGIFRKQVCDACQRYWDTSQDMEGAVR